MAKKLLVVDDTLAVAALICELARGLKFDCKSVNQPATAIDVFLDFQPEFVVLDMMMPEKDGIDVLHEILVINPSVRLILISSFGDGVLRAAAREAQRHGAVCVSLLRKPLVAAQFVGLLSELSERPSDTSSDARWAS